MTDFRDKLYFYPEKKKTYFFNQGVSFLSRRKIYSLHTKMMSFGYFLCVFFYILVTLRFEMLRF